MARTFSAPGTIQQKPLLFAAIALLAVAVGIVVYTQAKSASPPAVAFGGPPTVYRQCTTCSGVFEGSADELRDKGQLDLEGIALIGEGSLCPKCATPTLKLARKCPKDGTVFVPDFSQGATSKATRCPKCGWDPFGP